jgi:hypothetical protein
MPFSSSGVYTTPAGSTPATPGELIQSAIWNSIFGDIANALTSLAQGQVVQTPRVITSPGAVAVSTSDTIILIQAAAATITLPDSTLRTAPVTIVGNASGIFTSNNSALNTTGGQTINGLASGAVILKVDYQSITLLPLSSGGWVTI